jgi:hypothetical protein
VTLDLEAIKRQADAAERAWKLLPTPPSVALSAADVPKLVAEVERLRADLADAGRMAREDYARAEQAEQALVATKAEMERLRATALAASWRVDL